MKYLLLFLSMAILLSGNNLFAQTEKTEVSGYPPGPGSYKILQQSEDPIRIPFRMHNGKPLMNLGISGRKATLMIDNGILWDQVWLFGSPLVEELQLKPLEESAIEGAGEGDPTAAYTSHDLKLTFDAIEFYDQPVLVSPPAAGFARMFPGADGQLCNTFFRHFIVEFDFIRNEVVLHHPEHFRYEGPGTVLDMKANESGTYSVPFTLTMADETVYTDWVDIDFGGIYALKIALNNKHQIELPSDAEPASSFGAQGRSTEYRGKIQSMIIGKYRFDNPTVYFGDGKTSRIHPDNLGVIGLPMFMNFKIIFDYFHNRLYIEPNQRYFDQSSYN